jgi:hypothetical protein
MRGKIAGVPGAALAKPSLLQSLRRAIGLKVA